MTATNRRKFPRFEAGSFVVLRSVGAAPLDSVDDLHGKCTTLHLEVGLILGHETHMLDKKYFIDDALVLVGNKLYWVEEKFIHCRAGS